MNNEFLRPRENSCKWFNKLGVVMRRLFIERGEKTKFSHKNNRVNRFTKCLNRFRQQKDRPEKYEGWYDSRHIWVDSSVPRWRLNQFKLCMNRFNASQRVLWDDSSKKETMHTWIDSNRCESIHMKSKTLLNRFRLWWVDSNWSKMIFDTFSNDTRYKDQTT
jgi:hypothetical protein